MHMDSKRTSKLFPGADLEPHSTPEPEAPASRQHIEQAVVSVRGQIPHNVDVDGNTINLRDGMPSQPDIELESLKPLSHRNTEHALAPVCRQSYPEIDVEGDTIDPRAAFTSPTDIEPESEVGFDEAPEEPTSIEALREFTKAQAEFRSKILTDPTELAPKNGHDLQPGSVNGFTRDQEQNIIKKRQRISLPPPIPSTKYPEVCTEQRPPTHRTKPQTPAAKLRQRKDQEEETSPSIKR